MLVQNNLVKLNYIEKGLSRLCSDTVCTGNSHMRFYDITSWSYVTLDDPVIYLSIQSMILGDVFCSIYDVNVHACEQ